MDKKLLKRKREDESSNRAHDFFTRTGDIIMGSPTKDVADFDKSSNEGDENEDEENEEDDDEMPSAKFRRGKPIKDTSKIFTLILYNLLQAKNCLLIWKWDPIRTAGTIRRTRTMANGI